MRLNSFDLIISSKISSFKSVIKVDSDKSLSIRSFLIGAISQKISIVKNVLESEDVFSCISCLKKLGVKIDKVKTCFNWQPKIGIDKGLKRTINFYKKNSY